MPGETLTIRADLYQAMLDEVLKRLPEEACGLVGGVAGSAQVVYPVENSLHRVDRFQMDPAGQLQAFYALEEQGMELVAIFHSHPNGPAVASPTDLAEAAYPEAVYLIWAPDARAGSGWQVRGFFLRDGTVIEVRLVLLPDEKRKR